MSGPIAEDVESDELQRFHADFRRALLMHRKGRLALIFRIQFPTTADPHFDGVDALAQLDLARWLAPPPDAVTGHPVFESLVEQQRKVIDIARSVLGQAANHALAAGSFSDLLRAMQAFDRTADRLQAGITSSLTDVDELTGLLNRVAMERDLEREQAHAQRTGQPVTIAMVDADHFKKVNDSYGHGFGDFVLETLAERFVESLRPHDRVYRYGGEEFLVLLPATPLDQAGPVLERLRCRSGDHAISDNEATVRQSVSIGAAEIGESEAIEAAIGRADEALYRAKEAGRNRVVLAEQGAGT